MRVFSFFTGIGGFELGLPEGWEVVGYSEIYPEAIKIYEKHFPKAKNYGDITKIDPRELPDFEIALGGFPCQPFSQANPDRLGFADARGTLFFELMRIIKEKRPRHILLENVPGLLSHDQGRTYKIVVSSLDELDYFTEGLVFDGWFFGASPRKRIYMHAHDRKLDAPHREGEGEAIPLYSCFREKIGDSDAYAREPESVRNAERIIRTFAKLPDWLHSWDPFYSPEKSIGKRSSAESSEGNIGIHIQEK